VHAFEDEHTRIVEMHAFELAKSCLGNRFVRVSGK
jgi:hypothetical protein